MANIDCSGTEFVFREDGLTYKPKGIALGGALLLESYFFGNGGNEDLRHTMYVETWRTKFETDQDFENWLRIYQENYITQSDVSLLYDQGFNCIRIPFHYNQVTDGNNNSDEYWENASGVSFDGDECTLFRFVETLKKRINVEEYNRYVKNSGEDEVTEHSISVEQEAEVDLVDKTKKIFLVLDMHACPGSQSGLKTSDAEVAGKALLETNETKQNIYMNVWKAISQKYKSDVRIFGYELMNEPVFETNEKNKKLRYLHNKVIKWMRDTQDDTIVIVHGNYYARDFEPFLGADSVDDITDEENCKPHAFTNVAYGFHLYFTPPVTNHDSNQTGLDYNVNAIEELRGHTGVPWMNTEFGENSNEWIARYITVLEDGGLGWIFWTNKKWDEKSTITKCKLPVDKLVDTYTEAELGQLSDSLKHENIEHRLVLQRLLKGGDTGEPGRDYMERRLPYNQIDSRYNNTVPGRVLFAGYDYGLGLVNYIPSNDNSGNPVINTVNAGFDDDNAMDIKFNRPRGNYDSLVTELSSNYNTGKLFRNDAVDIEKHNGEYVVAYTTQGETLRYTLNVPQGVGTTSCDILLEYAAPVTVQGAIEVRIGNSILEIEKKGASYEELSDDERKYDKVLYLDCLQMEVGDNEVECRIEETGGVNLKSMTIVWSLLEEYRKRIEEGNTDISIKEVMYRRNGSQGVVRGYPYVEVSDIGSWSAYKFTAGSVTITDKIRCQGLGGYTNMGAYAYVKIDGGDYEIQMSYSEDSNISWVEVYMSTVKPRGDMYEYTYGIKSNLIGGVASVTLLPGNYYAVIKVGGITEMVGITIDTFNIVKVS